MMVSDLPSTLKDLNWSLIKCYWDLARTKNLIINIIQIINKLISILFDENIHKINEKH